MTILASRLSLAAVLFGAVLLAGGCAGQSAAVVPPFPPTPDMAPPVRVAVDMFEMGYAPAQIRVPAGRPVIFEVTNTGVVPHEFYVGPEESQQHHADEMAAGTEPHHDGQEIMLDPGDSGELMMEFWTHGELLVGCHVPGHYEAGMKANLTIVPSGEWVDMPERPGN